MLGTVMDNGIWEIIIYSGVDSYIHSVSPILKYSGAVVCSAVTRIVR